MFPTAIISFLPLSAIFPPSKSVEGRLFILFSKQCLKKSKAKYFSYLAFSPVNIHPDPVRFDSRFIDLLRRIGLEK
jgi:hypothetical protein